MYPVLKKNRNLRSVRIIDENQQLSFYLAGAKEANCAIYSGGKMMTISHVHDWQRVKIENVVKGAMVKAGYVINDSTFNLVKKFLPLRALIYRKILNYDQVILLLNLIPDLMEKLLKAETSWLTLVDYPYLVLFDPIIEGGEKAGLTIRPTVEDASKILQLQLSCFDHNSRKRIKRILKKKINTVGLATRHDDLSVDKLLDDEFFDEDGHCCSQNISLQVVNEGKNEEKNPRATIEILAPRKWRIKI